MASTKGTKRKFSDIQMVLLVVGQGKAKISVHENVLFEASPVFETAFNSRFKESSERSIYLPDDDAALMDVLVQSLYAPKSAPKSRLRGDTRMDSFRLYVLAEKYDVVKVKNQTCKSVLSWLDYERSLSTQYTSRPRISSVEFIYENTTSTAPMRRLLVDWFVWGVDLAWFNNEKNRSGLLSVPEFAVDVCAVLAKDFNKKVKARPFMKNTSVYLEEEPVGVKSEIN